METLILGLAVTGISGLVAFCYKHPRAGGNLTLNLGIAVGGLIMLYEAFTSGYSAGVADYAHAIATHTEPSTYSKVNTLCPPTPIIDHKLALMFLFFGLLGSVYLLSIYFRSMPRESNNQP